VSCTHLNLRLSPVPELLASFRPHLGCDVVELVLADQDGWDKYEAANWLPLREWLEATPDDEFAEKRSSPN
jgi:hypothetical protein